MGVGQNLGSSLLGSTVAPLVLVWIATTWGWRTGFYLAAIPGLITAALIWLTLREPPKEPGSPPRPRRRSRYREAIAHRNVLLCAAIAVLLVSYLVVAWSFLPLFLVNLKGYSGAEMGGVMAVLGVSSAISAFVLAGAQRPLGPQAGVPRLVPDRRDPARGRAAVDRLAVVMAAIFFVGWFFNGMFPLFMATVPAESVDPRLTASLAGFVGGDR